VAYIPFILMGTIYFFVQRLLTWRDLRVELLQTELEAIEKMPHVLKNRSYALKS
jgi:hypothetical protein